MINKPGYKTTDIGEIPKDWDAVRLGDKRFFVILASGIDHFTGTKRYLSTKSIENDEIVNVECEITFDKRPSRANMQPKLSSVWFAKMKNTVKVYCFTNSNMREETERFILSTGFAGVLCKDGIDPTYLKQVFLSDYFNREKNELASGSTQQAVNNEGILSILVPLPPLLEQQKIASIISTAHELTKETSEIIQKTQELKKSLTQQLLTKGVGHTKFKQTEIGEIPEEWTHMRIGEVSRVVRGSTPRPARDPRYFGGSFDWITVSELTKDRGIFLRDTSMRITEEGAKRSRRVEPGTLLLANSGFSLGVPKITQITGYINDGIAALLDLSQCVVPSFLYYCLSRLTPYLRSVVARGVDQPNLNTTLISELEIPIPPVAEQKRIADVLYSIDEKVERETEYRYKLEILRKGLMKDLLTGRVRVKVD